MEAKTTSPPAASVAALFNGRQVELLAGYVDPVTAELHTIQYRETRRDLGETAVFDDRAWERRAPLDALLHLPSSGHILSKLGEYWILWQTGAQWTAQPAGAERPVSLASAPGERLAGKPVACLGDVLHAYVWRGRQLLRHRFHSTEGASTAPVIELDFDVVHSACTPVPGDTDGVSVIAACGVRDGGIVASALYVKGARAIRQDGVYKGAGQLMKEQRIGLHAGTSMQPAAAMIVQQPEGKYTLAEARFRIAAKECAWSAVPLEAVRAGTLQSAAAFYYQRESVAAPFAAAIDDHGRFLQPRAANTQVVREDGAPSLPILTAMSSRYEVTGAGAAMLLKKF